MSFFRMRLVTGSRGGWSRTARACARPVERRSTRGSPGAGRAHWLNRCSERFGPDPGALCAQSTHDERARAIASDCSDRSRAPSGESAPIAQTPCSIRSAARAGRPVRHASVEAETGAANAATRLMEESGARMHLLEPTRAVRLAHDPELAMLLIQCSRA